ncbi:high affinity glucose transporter [Rhodotorula toruloides]|uniref:RHTO0S17e03356g1_1 n=2 Tax=Rhodotorula toruloides TaxID=5286 RepID=A0A061BEL9_RHOTO|nr:MFS glucose transporter [Rhodotorula toruloides NP11]EMS20529.1 MFS glucose transporter [Rhodotorula toruloides NP11]CDR48427.1 RHTO0S17e03356g1_1 [Rhodotorula toruloides]
MVGPKRSLLTKFTRNQYLVGSLPTLGGLIFGLDISSMSAQLSNPYYLETFNHPDSTLQGLINAVMPLGSFFGALFNSYLCDLIGRKWCIIISGWSWVIGAIVQSTSKNVGALMGGRVVAGLAVGLASAIVTICRLFLSSAHQAEITKPQLRGRIVSVQQLSIILGIAVQYFVQLGFSYLESDKSFRIPWALQLIPGAILGSLMFIFPESPRWLMDHGRDDEALQILADVHAAGDTEDPLVQLEFSEIKRQIAFDNQQGAKSYLDLLKPDVRLRVFLGCADQMWSQLSGMNVMMYYVVYVFQGAGLQGRRAELIASSVQYALALVCTVPAVIWLDKIGRRPLLVGGSAAMATCLMIVGALQKTLGHKLEGAEAAATTTWVVTGHKSGSYAIIVFSYLFVCSFSATLGPCSWTYASEIFPTRVRGKAVSFATASNWIFNFILSMTTPPAFRNIQYRVYFLYGTFNICSFLHFFFMYPETKGRTLEEMEEIFDGTNTFTAWRVPPAKGIKNVADIESSAGRTPSMGEVDDKDLKGGESRVENVHSV